MKYLYSFIRNITRSIRCLVLTSAVASISLGSAGYALEKGPSSATIFRPDWKQSVLELRARRLSVPIDGYDPEQMKGAFYQGRVGHVHHAADLLAPRNTPIRAVEDGRIERLFESAAGGLTIYQMDPTGRFVYYYAHLESYAEGLKDGIAVKRGQVIGYVGTSGNAPPNTPHLHFAISVIPPGGRVFRGLPVDPYEVYSKDASVVGTGTFGAENVQVVSSDDTQGKPSDKLRSNSDVTRANNKTLSIRANSPHPQQHKPVAPNRQTQGSDLSRKAPTVRPAPMPPSKIPANKPKKIIGSNSVQKGKGTPKSDKIKKLSKSSTPQKKPVVLRKLNKSSMPKKLTVNK